MLEYQISLLKEHRNGGYKIADVVKRAVEDGWRIHTWTVLDHQHRLNDSNHGHGFDNEMEVSVLFEREQPAPRENHLEHVRATDR